MVVVVVCRRGCCHGCGCLAHFLTLLYTLHVKKPQQGWKMLPFWFSGNVHVGQPDLQIITYNDNDIITKDLVWSWSLQKTHRRLKDPPFLCLPASPSIRRTLLLCQGQALPSQTPQAVQEVQLGKRTNGLQHIINIRYPYR